MPNGYNKNNSNDKTTTFQYNIFEFEVNILTPAAGLCYLAAQLFSDQFERGGAGSVVEDIWTIGLEIYILRARIRGTLPIE